MQRLRTPFTTLFEHSKEARGFIASIACLAALGTPGCSDRASAPEQQELARSFVVGSTRRSTMVLIEVCTHAECVVTTPEHPFARSTGWAPAGDLNVGDLIETARGRTQVSGARVLQVPPTDVYNLTVERTHTYFAGQSGFLVHNTDCGKPTTPADRLAEEREHERQKRALRHAQEVERDARKFRIQRELAAHRRRMDRLTLNDSAPDTPNCAYCSLGALNDTEKVSLFLHEHGPKYGLRDDLKIPDSKIQKLLKALGLTSKDALPRKKFRHDEMIVFWKPLLAQWVDRYELPTDFWSKRPELQSKMPEREALAHMKELPGNTNLLAYRYLELVEKPPGSGHFEVVEMAHAVLGVRREDGTIIYIDFQEVPPTIYQNMPATTFEVVVFPTTVDWRYNRQIYAAVRDGDVHPSL